MEFVNRPIVRFIKPHFIYNKETKAVIIVPTIADLNNPSTTTIDLMVEDWKEADTIEELMVEFDRLGLIMPDQDEWDFFERPLRLAIPNDDLTEIIKVMPTIIGLLDILKNFIIVRNRTQFIYLEEIYPEDRVKFANYLQERP